MEMAGMTMNSHSVVHAEPGHYCGWPANHGHWQWSDGEMLVGFLKGQYKKRSMHNIAPPFRRMFARSIDWGKTWMIEEPSVPWESHEFLQTSPSLRTPAIIKFMGEYDHGGEAAHPDGSFFTSPDRGKTWAGPWRLRVEGLPPDEERLCTTRTHVLDNIAAFLSFRNRRQWGSDYVIAAEVQNDHFRFLGLVAGGDHRAVMPSAVIHGDDLFVAVRRMGAHCYAEVKRAPMGTWDKWDSVVCAETGKHNGNPPALRAADGALCLVVGNRSEMALNLYIQAHGENQFSKAQPIRCGGAADIGYPVLFNGERRDELLCVYYWADSEIPRQHIAATKIVI